MSIWNEKALSFIYLFIYFQTLNTNRSNPIFVDKVQYIFSMCLDWLVIYRKRFLCIRTILSYRELSLNLSILKEKNIPNSRAIHFNQRFKTTGATWGLLPAQTHFT